VVLFYGRLLRLFPVVWDDEGLDHGNLSRGKGVSLFLKEHAYPWHQVDRGCVRGGELLEMSQRGTLIKLEGGVGRRAEPEEVGWPP
jgi:hypothetical protein